MEEISWYFDAYHSTITPPAVIAFNNPVIEQFVEENTPETKISCCGDNLTMTKIAQLHFCGEMLHQHELPVKLRLNLDLRLHPDHKNLHLYDRWKIIITLSWLKNLEVKMWLIYTRCWIKLCSRSCTPHCIVSFRRQLYRFNKYYFLRVLNQTRLALMTVWSRKPSYRFFCAPSTTKTASCYCCQT